MNILLLSRYSRLGASSRIRMYQYLPELERRGIAVTAAPLFDDAYLHCLYSGRKPSVSSILRYYCSRLKALTTSRSFDLIWLQCEAFPWLPMGDEFLRLTGIPYLVDYDDAIFHRYDRHRHAWVRWLLGRKIDRVMRGAAAVTAGNDYLVKRAQAAGAQRVEMIPSVVDLENYLLRPSSQAKLEVITIGWIGTPVTARYLDLVIPSLREVARQQPLRLLAVGSGPLTIEGVEVVMQPWAEATEAELIRSMDIGIMPLSDKPWERGKCGYKLIQYMACALPVVASPVGVNRQLVLQGKTGILAATTAEWTTALLQLAGNAAIRAKLGRGGRALVEERYCLQRTAPVLTALLRQLAGKDESARAG